MAHPHLRSLAQSALCVRPLLQVCASSDIDWRNYLVAPPHLRSAWAGPYAFVQAVHQLRATLIGSSTLALSGTKRALLVPATARLFKQCHCLAQLLSGSSTPALCVRRPLHICASSAIDWRNFLVAPPYLRSAYAGYCTFVQAVPLIGATTKWLLHTVLSGTKRALRTPATARLCKQSH